VILVVSNDDFLAYISVRCVQDISNLLCGYVCTKEQYYILQFVFREREFTFIGFA
jgi:hypothetical protein